MQTQIIVCTHPSRKSQRIETILKWWFKKKTQAQQNIKVTDRWHNKMMQNIKIDDTS